ncbi:MAG: hemolysin family protein [Chloroflexota bacterium]
MTAPHPLIWLVLVILILDLLAVWVRSALVNTRLPVLMQIAGQRAQPSVEREIALIEKVAFRLGLRLVISISHILLAVSGVFIGQAYYPAVNNLFFWLGVFFAAGLLLVALEISVEGLVRRNAENWLLRLYPLARGLEVLLRPFSALLEALMGKPLMLEPTHGGMTEDELKTWVEVGEPTGGLEKGERQMIYSIFHFGDTLCREIMVPRIDILALEVNTRVPEAVEALVLSGHSRVPVYDETIDNIIGLLYAKDLLRASLDESEPENIRPFLRPAYFVPESKKVDDLLREMQLNSIHMAIVVDEYGGTAGLVTLEDIVEEIVGEIRDEYDQAEELLYQRISPDEVLFHGRVDLDDFNEVLGTNLVTDLADTLGGYIYGVIGRVPTGGEQVQVEDWLLTVEQVSGRRIRRVRARRQSETAPAQNALNESRG